MIPGEPTAADRFLALAVVGPVVCAGGLAATRLALRLYELDHAARPDRLDMSPSMPNIHNHDVADPSGVSRSTASDSRTASACAAA